MINPALAIPREALPEFCQRNAIRELAVFGSATRDDFRPESSDVDLLVEFEPDAPIGLLEYCRIARELSDMFRRKVDLVEKAGLKSAIRERVLSEAETLYAQ